MQSADHEVEDLGPQLLTVGRINLDLYVDTWGTEMADATGFRASVGGSPTNIAIVARRLGVSSALLSATGDDYAAGLLMKQLSDFGVDTRWVYRLDEGATSLALLATLTADLGQRQFYRHHPADAYLGEEVLDTLPWDSLRAIVISGDAMAAGTTPATIATLTNRAAQRFVPVWWDLDLRPSSWPTSAAYADAVAPALQGATGVIGTVEEYATLYQQDPLDRAAVEAALRRNGFPEAILKLGAQGALWINEHSDVEAAAASTTPLCTVGGGDATAGAMIAGRLAGLSRGHALELAMRVAAHTVEQPYCSTGFPSAADVGFTFPSSTNAVMR
ncbi:MAG: PfkB family carbohydrate kinase [Mycobacterium sp.]